MCMLLPRQQDHHVCRLHSPEAVLHQQPALQLSEELMAAAAALMYQAASQAAGHNQS